MELAVNKLEKPAVYTNWKRCYVICYYANSTRPSKRIIGEYSLSGIIVTAINYFTTAALQIERIEIYEEIEAGGKLMHTEYILASPAGIEEIEDMIDLISYNRIRRKPHNKTNKKPRVETPGLFLSMIRP